MALSHETRMIVQTLRAVPEGAMIEYAEIGKAIECNILDHRHHLESARQVLCREHNILFECVRNFGLKRVVKSRVTTLAMNTTLPKIRRAADRGVQKLDCVDYTAMSKDEQRRYNAGFAQLKTIASFASRKAMKSFVNAGVKTNENTLDKVLRDTLKAFQTT